MHERHVEHIDPVSVGVALVEVAVPAVPWSEQEVAAAHRQLDAVDDGVAARPRIHDQSHGVGRVSVRAGVLPGLDHLVGRDQRAHGVVVVVAHRVEQQQVTSLGQLCAYPAASLVEGRGAHLVAPVHGPEFRGRSGPEGRPLLVPSRGHAAGIQHGVKGVQICCILQSKQRLGVLGHSWSFTRLERIRRVFRKQRWRRACPASPLPTCGPRARPRS